LINIGKSGIAPPVLRFAVLAAKAFKAHRSNMDATRGHNLVDHHVADRPLTGHESKNPEDKIQELTECEAEMDRMRMTHQNEIGQGDEKNRRMRRKQKWDKETNLELQNETQTEH
jgi:hypothetical protein